MEWTITIGPKLKGPDDWIWFKPLIEMHLGAQCLLRDVQGTRTPSTKRSDEDDSEFEIRQEEYAARKAQAVYFIKKNCFEPIVVGLLNIKDPKEL